MPAVDKEIRKLPREYIGNICKTLAGDTFAAWVKHRVDARNAKLAEDRQVAIEMDPAIDTIFQQSNAISGKLAAERLWAH